MTSDPLVNTFVLSCDGTVLHVCIILWIIKDKELSACVCVWFEVLHLCTCGSVFKITAIRLSKHGVRYLG